MNHDTKGFNCSVKKEEEAAEESRQASQRPKRLATGPRSNKIYRVGKARDIVHIFIYISIDICIIVLHLFFVISFWGFLYI